VHYSPYDPHGGVHDGPLVTGRAYVMFSVVLRVSLL
jgi:hypothetical protein